MSKAFNKHSRPSVFLASEFVIIVLGVLVALGVDNWNSNRKDRKTRDHLIESLLSDLREDRGDYEEFVNGSRGRVAAADLISQLAKNSSEWTQEQIGQAREALYYLGGTPRLETVESTFREMSALGSGATMGDETLRLQISYYYGLARDRSDINELLRPGILRYRESLEDVGLSYVDRQSIDVDAVIANKRTLAIIRELGKTTESAARMAADLLTANAELVSRLEEFQEQ